MVKKCRFGCFWRTAPLGLWDSFSVSPGILHTWLSNEKNCLDGLFDVFSCRKRPQGPFLPVLHFNAYSNAQVTWEHELSTSLSITQWHAVWRSAMSASKCVRFRIIQYQILNQAYFPPVCLSKMDNKHNISCWLQCGKRGSLRHLCWDRPAVKALWVEAI